MGDGLQMLRVDAPAVPAQMVKLQAAWDKTHKHFTDHAVGKPRAALGAENPVAVFIYRTQPKPALLGTRAVGVLPQPIFRRQALRPRARLRVGPPHRSIPTDPTLPLAARVDIR